MQSTPSTLAITPPSLPKGGGAITGLGESLGQAGPTGMASMSLPLPITAGRGFAPALGLSYSSGAGNGLFGIGWGCGALSISRRTSHGIPQYNGQDTFLGPDGEVLVPEQNASGQIITQSISQYGTKPLGATYTVTCYLPRIEGSFNRIEYWLDDTNQADFWLLHTTDGTLHLLGKSTAARIADPKAPTHTAVWLIEESVSAVGEHIWYQYQAENTDNVTDTGRDQQANRYLSQVNYGNVTASPDLFLWDGNTISPEQTTWLFTLIFDYGERTLDPATPPPFIPMGQWLARPDAFSRYEYGFEVRTHRLCRQVLMYHHFPTELGEPDTLVKRLLLEYELDASLSRLTAAQQLAYEKDGTLQQLPPLELGYTAFSSDAGQWQSMPALPGFNDGQHYHLVDLYGEGLPGVLYRAGQDWRYRAPVRASTGGDDVAYDDWQVLPQVPAMQGDRFQLLDITGDGHLDWVVAQPGMAGFFTLNSDGTWGSFTPFGALPIEYFHPQAQLTQLVGSGLVDLALIGPKTVRLYANQGTEFAVGIDVAQDETVYLPTARKNASSLVVFADMLGSGQGHLVEIQYNQVRCWPNLGYGRFGASIDLPLPSLIDSEAAFNPNQLFLADIDGSGTTDLVYAQHKQVTIYLNQSGNGFAAPQVLPLPDGVTYDRLCQITLADVQGNGCTELVLTVPYMTPSHWRYAFTPQKPYLLSSVDNNLGATTRLNYRSSAQSWLDEKQDNPTAVPALPLTLMLLDRVTSCDNITGNTLIAQSMYRQGVYDGQEREFRGFGYVETQDTAIEALPSADSVPLAAPLLTRSWYHCGRQADESSLYGTPYTGDSEAPTLPSTRLTKYDFSTQQDVVLQSTNANWWLYRSLKGHLLRSETYAVDETGQPGVTPYTCGYSRFQVRLIQDSAMPVVMPVQLENVQIHYEQLSFDPIISHHVLIQQDQYGTLLWQVNIAYPRRANAQQPTPYPSNLPDDTWEVSYDAQQTTLRIDEQLASVYHLDNPQIWCLGLPYQQRGNQLFASALPPQGISYETLTAPNGLLAAEAPRTYTGQTEVVYQVSPPTSLPALVDHLCTAVLDAEALNAYQGIGYLEHFDFKKAGYTQVDTVLDIAGVSSTTVWAVNSHYTTYETAAYFYRPLTQQSTQLNGATTLAWDTYSLVLVSQTDAMDNISSATYDYRFLTPSSTVDINGNTQEVQLDALARVVNSSRYGTESGGETVGFNTVAQYPVSPTLTVEEAITHATTAGYVQQTASISVTDLFSWMGQITTADVAQADWQTLLAARYITASGYVRAAGRQWANHPQSNPTVPAHLASILAEVGGTPVHAVSLTADNYPTVTGQQTAIALSYSDGFGRVLQQCALVAPGPAWQYLTGGEVDTTDTEANPRWAVSGRVEYDNKGQVVRQYQPFFLNDWYYVIDRSLNTQGYCDTHYYDALGRESHTITALAYLRRTTYYSWFTVNEDENDTQTNTLYTKTPTVSVRDNRGQVVRLIQYNRTDPTNITATPDTQVTHTVIANGTRTPQHWDARLFTANAPTPNLQTQLDLTGKTLRRESTDSGMQTTLYDAEGRLIWRIDGAGTISQCAYDVLGRVLTRCNQANGAAQRIAARYIYGDNDSQTLNPQNNNLRGQCVRQYDEGGKLTHDSVALSGAVLKITQQLLKNAEQQSDWQGDESAWIQQLDTTIYTTTSQANALGATTSQTDAANHMLNSTYDVSGTPITSTLTLAGETAQTLLSGLTYSAAGQPLTETAGNGVVTAYAYEPQTQWLSNMTATRTADKTVLQNLSYGYDPVGNITTIADGTVATSFFRNQATTGARTFSYDALYQLISATGRESANHAVQNSDLPPLITPIDASKCVNYTRSYIYDRSGNLSSFQHNGASQFTQSMVTDTGSNRSVQQNSNDSLQPSAVPGYFDVNGNLKQVQAPSTSPLLWNSDNQLHTVVLVDRGGALTNNDREVYQYRGGMRVRKQTRTLANQTTGLWNVQEVRYLPGLELRTTYQETVTDSGSTPSAPSESLQVVTTQAGRSNIRVLHWQSTPPSGIANDQVRYSINDQIGSLLLELDNTGQTITQEEYYPYGGTAVWAARSQFEADYKTIRYSGKERDATGLYYYGYRYYAPWLCRWLNADPAQEIDGLNLFRMVSNNPITLKDAMGLNPYVPEKSEFTKKFQNGGILYGLDKPRENALKALEEAGFTRTTPAPHSISSDADWHHILIQNDITNVVWRPAKPTQYSTDEQIRSSYKDPNVSKKDIRVSDPERVIQFKEFLSTHPKYNVKNDPMLKGEFTLQMGVSLWKKTSKAGLEFQLVKRNAPVHFLLDTIGDNIANVVSKAGYGASITSSELRWLYRHRETEAVKNNVIFWNAGEIVKQDTIFSNEAWRGYQQKTSYQPSWSGRRVEPNSLRNWFIGGATAFLGAAAAYYMLNTAHTVSP
jgi:RHS repeat-associated protein